jgi:hypothetical protein
MRLPHLYTDAYILESSSKLVATAALPTICQLMQKFTEDAASFDSDSRSRPDQAESPRSVQYLHFHILRSSLADHQTERLNLAA